MPFQKTIRKTRRGQLTGWKQALAILLLLLLALLLVFSRGQRAARRLGPDGPVKTSYLEERKNKEQNMKQKVPAVSREVLLGHIDPTRDPDFVEVDVSYASRAGMYMRREAYEAFLEMHDAARAEGINLRILSATRPFDHQKRIWENKWHGRQSLHGGILATSISDPAQRAREILRFSAMPGTSRHHWGTDIDLNSLQNDYFTHGEGKEVYRWLQDNALDFGFCQPYTAHGQQRTGGYEEEKWHWSYRPLAKHFLASFRARLSHDDISGFSGAELAEPLEVIERYVLDINTECQ